MCIHRCESSTVSSSSHHFFSSIFYCDREDAERVKKKEKFREREKSVGAFSAMRGRERKVQREKVREREVCCTHM
jgi:hypothetical protein